VRDEVHQEVGATPSCNRNARLHLLSCKGRVVIGGRQQLTSQLQGLPMKTGHLVSSLVLLLAASAGVRAEKPSTDILNFVSYRTREEVRQELFAYKKSGVNPWATSYYPLKYFHSVATRAEVMAEFFAFREEGCFLYAEDSGSAYLSRLGLPGGAAIYASVPPADPLHAGEAMRMPHAFRRHGTAASS
jgi:hypothetical protein